MKIILAIFAIFLAPAVTAAADRFKITVKKANDSVTMQGEQEKPIFSVKSPSGISQVVVERNEERWPEATTFQFHMRGLESLTITNGKVELSAAVTSHDGNIRVWKDGKEDALLNDKSPFWMKIHIRDANGKPINIIPIKNGYFEMTLPKALFENNPKSITLQWIDFYRN